jgi:hypothetical protein
MHTKRQVSLRRWFEQAKIGIFRAISIVAGTCFSESSFSRIARHFQSAFNASGSICPFPVSLL